MKQSMYCKDCGLTWVDQDGCCVHCGVEATIVDVVLITLEQIEQAKELLKDRLRTPDWYDGIAQVLELFKVNNG
jgi:hypothetical protein